jgi:hypothetical protein
MQEQLAAFFYQLRFREDILCHPALQEVLSIPSLKYPIELYSSIKASDTYNLTSFQLIGKVRSIIASSEYKSVFKGIGKLWSLIETQSLGEVTLLGYDDSLFKIENSATEQQIKCCFWRDSEFECLLGLESGGVYLMKFKMKLAANSKGVFDSNKLSIASKTLIKLHSTAIIKIAEIEKQIITISIDSILKVSLSNFHTVHNETIDPVGGGSLKQRLNNDKLLTLTADSLTNKLFLGTEQGKILVYLLENHQPKYLYSISCESSVRDLDVKWGTIYAAAGSCILAFSECKEFEILARFNCHLEGSDITCIKYTRENDRVFAGYAVRIT